MLFFGEIFSMFEIFVFGVFCDIFPVWEFLGFFLCGWGCLCEVFGYVCGYFSRCVCLCVLCGVFFVLLFY